MGDDIWIILKGYVDDQGNVLEWDVAGSIAAPDEARAIAIARSDWPYLPKRVPLRARHSRDARPFELEQAEYENAVRKMMGPSIDGVAAHLMLLSAPFFLFDFPTLMDSISASRHEGALSPADEFKVYVAFLALMQSVVDRFAFDTVSPDNRKDLVDRIGGDLHDYVGFRFQQRQGLNSEQLEEGRAEFGDLILAWRDLLEGVSNDDPVPASEFPSRLAAILAQMIGCAEDLEINGQLEIAGRALLNRLDLEVTLAEISR